MFRFAGYGRVFCNSAERQVVHGDVVAFGDRHEFNT